MRPCIHIENQSSASELPAEEDPPSWISACLEQLEVQEALASRPAAFSVVFVNAAFAKETNSQFRGKDYATNVLSFPADLPEFITSQEQGFTLGDLLLCPEVVAREAREQNKRLIDHYTHLIVHGFLHLLGFDHETQAQALVMETVEIRTLSALDVANPYNETNQTTSSESA